MFGDLNNKSCVSCQGGIIPLPLDEANEYKKQIPKWDLMEQSSKLKREFKFEDFKHSLKFIDRVAAIAEEEGHHPDIEFGWGYARIYIYTHDIDGLHKNDFILASKIDLIKY